MIYERVKMYGKRLNVKYSFVFLVFVIVLTSFLSSCQTDLSRQSEIVKPVTRGLEDFVIHDETYKGCHFQDDNNVLLTADHPTSDKMDCRRLRQSQKTNDG